MGIFPRRICIATRESPLAMRQTEMVAADLRGRYPGLAIEIVGMTTQGDRVLDRPLAQAGGKGLFVKELEVALAGDRADLAVHSMKDVPMQVAPGFSIASFGPREDPSDAFISTRYDGLDSLPPGAVVGTSSLRRECQLRSAYPQLQFKALRGNVNTRLAKLDRGDFDAIILAAAGLKRLGLEARIRSRIAPSVCLPAIAQGILAIEYLQVRDDIAAALAPFVHGPTWIAARAERAVGGIVEGGCEIPLAAMALCDGEAVTLEAVLGLPDGSRVLREQGAGSAARPEEVGVKVGERLLACGGREIIAALSARAT